MKRILRKLPLVVLIVCSSCYAGVAWETQELRVQATPGEEQVEFILPFKNTGQSPLHFDEPTTNCDCTLAKLDKAIYAEGESGAIKGTYSLAGRHGLNSVIITAKGVEIDGDTRRPFRDTLKVNITIPEAVKISPGITLWRKGSDVVSKTVRFEVNKSFTIPLKLAKISKDTFKGELKEVEQGKIYELLVTPVSTAAVGSAMVTVEGVTEGGKTMRFSAHLIVR